MLHTVKARCRWLIPGQQVKHTNIVYNQVLSNTVDAGVHYVLEYLNDQGTHYKCFIW